MQHRRAEPGKIEASSGIVLDKAFVKYFHPADAQVSGVFVAVTVRA